MCAPCRSMDHQQEDLTTSLSVSAASVFCSWHACNLISLQASCCCYGACLHPSCDTPSLISFLAMCECCAKSSCLCAEGFRDSGIGSQGIKNSLAVSSCAHLIFFTNQLRLLHESVRLLILRGLAWTKLIGLGQQSAEKAMCSCR